MITSKNPDPQKGLGENARWVYQKVANGAKVEGFLAGRTVGVFVHYVGTSKPCRKMMTSGALTCAHCESGSKPAWRGYVPFYDQDYQRRFVLISDEFFVVVGEIPLHAQIRIYRDKSKRSPTVIRHELWRTQPWKPTPDKLDHVNLMPSLLLIWKDVELHAWNRKPTEPEAIIRSKLEFDGKPLREDLMADAFPHLKARMSSTLKEPSLVGDALDDLLPPDARPSKNGKHKKIK